MNNKLEALRLFQGQQVCLPLGGDSVLVGKLNEFTENYFSVTWSDDAGFIEQQVFNVSEVAEVNVTHEVTIVLGWAK